jgi:hypothetical protein
MPFTNPLKLMLELQQQTTPFFRMVHTSYEGSEGGLDNQSEIVGFLADVCHNNNIMFIVNSRR